MVPGLHVLGIPRLIAALNTVFMQTNQQELEQLRASKGNPKCLWRAMLTTGLMWLQAKLM